jgi:hypothetical protein
LNAGQALVTGAGAPTFGGRLLSAASSGALKGAAASAAAGGSPVTGAEYGAGLGPIGMAAAPIARGMMLLTGKAAGGALDALAPAAADTGSVGGPPPAPALPGSSTAPGGATSVNPLTGAPIETAQQIPTSLPKTGLSVTQKGADATADRIIAHFAQGGPTTINDNSLIAGSQPSLAQATGNAGLATLERAVQAQNAQPFAMRWQGNNAARMQVISGLTGTPGDIDAASAARDAMTTQTRNAAFANAKPVDAGPVVDQVQQLIAQNAGNPAAQNPFKQVLSQLVHEVPDPTVNPQTGQTVPGAKIEQPTSDPAVLYNVRKYISDLVSPRVSGSEMGSGQAAAAQLLSLKPVIDDTIESGAPGFKSYIAQYNQLSEPIDGMKALQGLNLTDAQGNVTLAKLDNAVKSLTKQQAASGYRQADSITPDQMGQLVTLRDDMRRENISSIGRSLGSNTFQNFATNSLINAAGSNVGHVVGTVGSALGGDAVFGPIGGVATAALSHGVSHYIGKLGENSRAMVMQSLTNKLLNPQAASSALQSAARKAGP